jgi:hypothetical protein
MVFFQIFLVAGYVYAHLLTQYCRPRTQSVVHLILLIVAFFILPITPEDNWKPESHSNPTWYILQLLIACLGLPYFVLSTTGPLLQKWFSVTYPGRSPYRLYVQSNWGSFFALGTYPFLIEPHFSRHVQATLWSFGLVFFALVCGYCALLLHQPLSPSSVQVREERTFPASLTAPSFSERLLWVGLAATASLLLLATTNKLSQEVAVVPFLWIVPLSIYLFSFILCFDNPERYSRTWFAITFFISIAELTYVMLRGDRTPIGLQVGVYLMTLLGLSHDVVHLLYDLPRRNCPVEALAHSFDLVLSVYRRWWCAWWSLGCGWRAAGFCWLLRISHRPLGLCRACADRTNF